MGEGCWVGSGDGGDGLVQVYGVGSGGRMAGVRNKGGKRANIKAWGM